MILICEIDNLTSSIIALTAKIVSSITISTRKITSINQFVFDLAFALLVFEETNHHYSHEVSNMMINIVKTIIISHRRSTISFFKRIRNTRNSSTEFISYFTIWAINCRVYKSALQHFYNRIEEYRSTFQYRSYLFRSNTNSINEFFKSSFYSIKKSSATTKFSKSLKMIESKKSGKHLGQQQSQQSEQQIRSSSSIQIKKIKTSMINDRLHFVDESFVISYKNSFNKDKRMIIEKKSSTISFTKKLRHRFDRIENFLKIIMKQMSFNFNRAFNYFKTQYAKNNVVVMIMIKNFQQVEFSFYWSYIESHDIEIVIATYRMLFDIKKTFYWNEIIKILKIAECSLKKKKNFRNFIKCFRSDFIIENNDLLKSIFI